MKWTSILLAASAAVVDFANGDTIFQLAKKTDDLSTLTALIKQARLKSVVNGHADRTVFAPVNSAFDPLAEITPYLLVNKGYSRGLLAQVLALHVLDKEALSTELQASEPTLAGEDVTIDISVPSVNGVTITAVDIEADNGVVHLIDGVLIPTGFPLKNIGDTAVDTSILSTLVTALTATGLAPVFFEAGNVYTVFAPSDAAFEALFDQLDTDLAEVASFLAEDAKLMKHFTNVLLSHVLGGKALTQSQVENKKKLNTLGPNKIRVRHLPDMIAEVGTLNGIVHVIDEVIGSKCARIFARRLTKLKGM